MKRLTRKQLNNKGFSLIELIVTLAIIALMVGVTALSYSLVKRTNVAKSNEYIKEAFSVCRQNAMSVNAYEWNVTLLENEIQVRKITRTEKGSDVITDNGKNYTQTTYNYVTELVQSYVLPELVKETVTLSDSSLVWDGSAEKAEGEGEGEEEDNTVAVTFVFSPLSGEISGIYKDSSAQGDSTTRKSAIGEDASITYFDIESSYSTRTDEIRVFTSTGKVIKVDK